MKNNKKVRIGCASAFWGDTSTAAKQLVEKGDLDYLVFDFLAEVTMSILARAKLKDSDKGFAGDFLTQIEPLLPKIKQKGIKILTNAGGINPISCRTMLERAAKKEGIDLKIAIVIGDDLIPELPKIKKIGITELDTGNSFPESCLSINAYLGAPGLVAALDKGADIVITGRCVDSALVLAPLMHEFNWNESEYDLLASGSLAGHIIECGAQCTGGNFTESKNIISSLHAQHEIKDENAKMVLLTIDGYYILSESVVYFIQFPEICNTMLEFKDALVKLANEHKDFELKS